MEIARLARLGVVAEPEVGHEQYQGRLAIPYVTKSGVVDLRFRSLNPAVEPKYMGLTGADTKMYNVLDILFRHANLIASIRTLSKAYTNIMENP